MRYNDGCGLYDMRCMKFISVAIISLICGCSTDFINLKSATSYAILAGSTIANTGLLTTIVGSVGLTPGSAITAMVTPETDV
jgi:hypothetical protein